MRRVREWLDAHFPLQRRRMAAYVFLVAMTALGFRSGHIADQHLKAYVNAGRERSCDTLRLSDARDQERWHKLIERADPADRMHLLNLIDDTFKNLPPPGPCQEIEAP